MLFNGSLETMQSGLKLTWQKVNCNQRLNVFLTIKDLITYNKSASINQLGMQNITILNH